MPSYQTCHVPVSLQELVKEFCMTKVQEGLWLRTVAAIKKCALHTYMYIFTTVHAQKIHSVFKRTEMSINIVRYKHVIQPNMCICVN